MQVETYQWRQVPSAMTAMLALKPKLRTLKIGTAKSDISRIAYDILYSSSFYIRVRTANSVSQ